MNWTPDFTRRNSGGAPFAPLERLRSQVLAVELEQIKGIEERDTIVLAAVQRFKPADD